ncbi:MAG: hypothetical protein U0V74_15310 [Chitinophagales bacterium]
MDALFELIQSLSPAEKGYFKKFAGKAENAEANNNLRLFEILEEQEDYNEAAAKKSLGKEKSANQFSVAKNYLYNSILKALTAYHEDFSLEIILRNYFSQVDLLTHRGLFQQALKTAQRAKVFAQKLERWDSVMQFNGLQRNLLLKAKPDDDSLSLKQLLQEFKEAQQQQQLIVDLEVMLQQQNTLINQSMNARSAEMLKANKDLFNTAIKKQPSCKRASHLLHCIRLNYFLHIDERAKAYKEAAAILTICSGFDYFNKYETLSLLNAYNQFLHAAFYTGEWKELEKKLKELHALSLRSELEQLWQFCYYAPFALAYYDKTGNKQAIEKLFIEAEKEVKQHRDKLRPDIFFGLIISFTSGLLEYGKYDKAVDWIDIYRNAPRLKQHYDNQSSVLILQLIAHYELGNLVLINSIIKNIEYFIKTNKQKSKFENLVLKFFRTLTAKAPSEKTTASLSKLHKEVQALASGNVLNKSRVIYPVVAGFMQSKIAGKPYHQFIGGHL